MVRIGKVSLGRSPVIVLTLTGSESLEAVRRAKLLVRARPAVPLLLEIRIDRFPTLDAEKILGQIRSLKRLGTSLIATIRSRKEGGGRSIPDSVRLQLFKKILPAVDAIDLELGSRALVRKLVPRAHRLGKQAILSHHDFKSTPSDQKLLALIRQGKRWGGDLVKLAVTPKRPQDVARLLLLTHRNREKHLVSIAMGRDGQVTRVLGPRFGSLLTYGFIGRAQALGQLSVARLSREIKALFPN